MFIKSLSPILLNDPKPQAVIDAPILAAVKSHKIDYLVTLNTRHFHTTQVREYLMTPIVTPGEFLAVFRTFWERAGS